MSMARAGWAGLACAAALSGSAAGQCHQWLQNTSVRPPTGDFTVPSFHLADLDGPGPLPEELLFGSKVHSVSVDQSPEGGVVRWDGSRFNIMPGRVSDSSGSLLFYDFESHQGRLFMSGKFTNTNSVPYAENIAEFRNGFWQRPLMNAGQSIRGRDAFQLLSDGSRLLVVGQDLIVNTGTQTTLARYENGQWASLRPDPATGLGNSTAAIRFGDSLMIGVVESTPQGTLAIDRNQAGTFTPSLYGSNGCVTASLTARKFEVMNGTLYACGNFYPFSVPAERTPLLRWDGLQWVDAGYPSEAVITGLADIHGLANLHGVTYAYGSECVRIPAIARLEADGTWTQVPVPPQLEIVDGPAAFFEGAVYDNKLFLGSRSTLQISMFDGTNWEFFSPPLGTGTASTPNDILVEGDDVYVCGPRNGMWQPWSTPNPSAIPSTPLGRLTPSGWTPVGSGFFGDGYQVQRWRNYIVVRGNIGVRFHDGSQWLSLVPNLTNVAAMTVWNDNLILASGGIVYSFDGAALTPVSPVSPPRAFNGGIFKLAVHEGQLIMCGSFTQMSRAGETPILRNSLVTWDGTEWQNFGPNAITGTVNNMLTHGSSLFLVGNPLRLEGVLQANTIRWNGSAWIASEGTASTFGVFTAMGGTVYRASGLAISKFDAPTNSWIILPRMGPVFSVNITGLAADADQRWLHVIGSVTRSGDIGVNGYGRLSMGQPVLERQPQNFSGTQGGLSAFSVDVLTERATYQWRKNGSNLVLGVTPSGSTIRGSDTPYLFIENTQPQDEGTYDCVITATCTGTPISIGTTTTQTALLIVTVPPTCDSIDFNNDASVFDPQDIEAFLSVYSEGPCVPATATCNDIDFNNDTSLFDPQDIAAFLSVYSEGPCI